MTNRLDGLDGLRALACAMVVFHHIGLQTDMSAVGTSLRWLGAFAARGGYGVVFFFVLSGFLLSLPFWKAIRDQATLPSQRVYWLRRFARIVPGFYVALTGSLFLAVTLNVTTPDAQTAARFLAGATFLSPFSETTFFPVELNGPLWSIAFEVLAYAGLPLCFMLLAALPSLSGSRIGRLALFTSLIALSAVLHKWHVDSITISTAQAGAPPLRVLGDDFFARYSVFAMFAIFGIGALAGAAHVNLIWQKGKAADAIALASLLVAAILSLGLGPDTGDMSEVFAMPYSDFPLLPISIAVFLVAAPRSKVIGRLLDFGPARYIALISFGIYIYHMPVLHVAGLLIVGEDLVAKRTGQALAVLSVTWVTTIVLAHLSFRKLEEPAMQWARRLEQRVAGERRPAASGQTDITV